MKLKCYKQQHVWLRKVSFLWCLQDGSNQTAAWCFEAHSWLRSKKTILWNIFDQTSFSSPPEFGWHHNRETALIHHQQSRHEQHIMDWWASCVGAQLSLWHQSHLSATYQRLHVNGPHSPKANYGEPQGSGHGLFCLYMLSWGNITRNKWHEFPMSCRWHSYIYQTQQDEYKIISVLVWGTLRPEWHSMTSLTQKYY